MSIVGNITAEEVRKSNVNSTRERLERLRLPEEEGIWKITSEPENPDFHAMDQGRSLGKVKGTYAQAVEYALGLKDFITWGGGGRIEPSFGEKIVDLDEHFKDLTEELKAELTDLAHKMQIKEAELEAAKAQRKELLRQIQLGEIGKI